jgi:hypothetical protein
MQRTLLLLLFGLLVSLAHYTAWGQTDNIFGKYIGLDKSVRSWHVKKNGKRGKTEYDYSTKTLQLNKDSTFSFDYWLYSFFGSAQGGFDKRCTGKWKLFKDTLYLTTKFNTTDFYSVKEIYDSSFADKLIKISSINPKETMDSDSWFGSVKVKVDNNAIGKCMENDTIYYKGPIKEEIFIYDDYQDMKWIYKPKSSLSNCFVFKLKRSNKGDNMFFANYKLIVKHNKLIPLTRCNALSIEGNKYYKRVK